MLTGFLPPKPLRVFVERVPAVQVRVDQIEYALFESARTRGDSANNLVISTWCRTDIAECNNKPVLRALTTNPR